LRENIMSAIFLRDMSKNKEKSSSPGQ